MTKPPQQTIGTTMYTVGQIVSFDELMKLPPDTKVDGFGSPKNLRLKELAFMITALPNPDPVADEWRVVEMLQHPNDWPFDTFKPLQLAMQEVCKADEVKWEYPEGLLNDVIRPFTLNSKDMSLSHIERIITCFLLGGTVKVRGGL